MMRTEPLGTHPLPALPQSTRETEARSHDRLYQACQQFESVFLLQLWRAMQRTVPQQRQTLNYTEMFDLTFAEYLARYGQFGLAEQLYEQLTRAAHATSPKQDDHARP